MLRSDRGFRKMAAKAEVECVKDLFTGSAGEFQLVRQRCRELLGLDAEVAIFAVGLVAEARGFPETVKMAFACLSFAVERDQGVLQTGGAEPVGVITIRGRLPIFPGFLTFYALVNHDSGPAFNYCFSFTRLRS